MPLNINQEDFNVVKQPFINKYLKLNILNFNLSVVNEISGNLISFDVSVNADSDLRRSCSVSLVVTDSSFEPENGSQIWLDKFIQPYVGYENIYTGEVQWYNQGIYLINTPTYFYDATNNTLSFQGLDLMSKLTGVRNGALPGVPTVIPQGSNVREAMIAAIKLAGFTKYVVDECVNTDGSVQAVPYDIQVNQGGYIFDIIKQLRDILPNYQVYFDVDGVFHYDQIPSGDNDPVLIDDTLWNEVNMSDNITTDFESVKNYIEVYGKSHTVNYFPSATSISGATLNLTISGYTETAGNMIGFVPTANILSKAYIRVNNGTSRRLVDSAENGVKNLEKDVYYVAVYQASNTYLFLGHQQAQAIATDDNPESPFYVNGSVGMIRQVLSGGDYDNIMSDELALQRAKLEIYWKCRLNDSIALTCIPIPWVDVNILVSHAPKSGDRQKKYMIKSFSASYGDSTTMTINAISYYAYYQPVTPEPEPILPEGYTQLEYIESSGTQYIDTGVSGGNSAAYEIVMNPLTASLSYEQYFAGDKNPVTPKIFREGTGTNMQFQGTTTFNANGLDSAFHDIEYSGGTVKIDGSTAGNTGAGGGWGTLTWWVFNAHGEPTLFSTMRLKSLKMWMNEILVRDFIPCKKPSGAVGLYDTVTKSFYGNAGGGNLPAGYTQVEYIQSNGAQYIDTGIKPNQNTRIVIDFTALTASVNAYAYGMRGDSAHNFNPRFGAVFKNASVRVDYGNGNGVTLPLTLTVGGHYKLDQNKNVCALNASTATNSTATFQCPNPAYLFAINEGGTAKYFATVKLYSGQVYDNGALIRNFVPARNASGTLGLYDTVNGAFYTNKGSGTFTAGADIVEFTAGEEITN